MKPLDIILAVFACLRRQDVEIQTRLVRPEVQIVYGLVELAECVRRWLPVEVDIRTGRR